MSAPRHWSGSGSTREIDWDGVTWTLRADDDRPGLRSARLGPLLALEGVSEVGRWEPSALSAASLESLECRFDRVEATYRPPGWGEMTVRASWFPVDEDGMGLEIELSARSVEELNRVEVRILSVLGELPEAGDLRSVHPRDREAAALSYDGREADLSRLVTGPPADFPGPWLVPRSGRDGMTYVEMAHPNDASRVIREGRLPFSATRYGLFGYDLERGVVLRGRFRAFWIPKSDAFTRAEAEYRDFLYEPPPLRT